ncbi:MAG: ATP-binding cassette domain-containing protein [Syntrophobacteraceae bacterium]|nr:ATP-binding cassette domain-containing protein [Syntrophobacteraceae bacterium]
MAFLREMDLLRPLLDLGEELAVQTVTLLRDLREDAFFFQLSPIGIDEFEEYNSVVSRLEDSGRDHIAKRDREALVGLALRFVPARHKMVALPHDLEERLLDARKAFITKMMKKDPGAFTFYHPTEYFYSQSILNNLLFGNLKEEQPQALDRVTESVVDFLRERGMIDEVMAAGLEFQVGSKGDRLSGGQKQKIAIARALLKKTPILILDEATASLDNTSQARIQQVLSGELKGRSTLIAVVHRLEMVRDFDGIAVMKAGRIVEMGRYDDLIAQKGLFYDLARGA